MTQQQQPWPALADASLSYQPDFLSDEQADQYLRTLRQTLAWQQDQIKLFGRAVAIPRLQCWYGDSGLTYRYSGLSMSARPWTSELQQLRRQIEQHSGYRFNAVLANLYRDGQDSMGWHADNEPELGTNPVIASLSLGQQRSFKLRRRDNPRQQVELELQHGSLLVMAGTTQQYWQHALPKRKRLNQPRVNLTFRLIR
ncbi:MAG: alpha-ketoglutarate-dependent dioxygenase AlkB [Motiliproteus sp.]